MRTYQKPMLVDLGHFTSLTLGDTGSGTDGGNKTGMTFVKPPKD